MVRDADNARSSQFDSGSVHPDNILYLDFETSTFNRGHPFDPRNKAVSYATHFNNVTTFKYYTDPDFSSFLREQMAQASELVGFHVKFDVLWCGVIHVPIPVNIKVWDCQLAEFIYSGQTNRFASLKETLDTYNLPRKKDDLVADYWANGVATEDIPVPILEEYNTADVFPSLVELRRTQQSLLNEKQINLVYTEGEDLKALADAEFNGVKFDVLGASAKVAAVNADLDSIHASLSTYLPPLPNHCSFNWDSGDQLSALLYGGTITYEYAISEQAVYKSGDKKGQEYTRNRWHSIPVEFKGWFIPLANSEVAKTKDDASATTRFYQTDAPTLAQLRCRTKEQKLLIELLQKRAAIVKVGEMAHSILEKMAEKNWQDNLIHGQFNQTQVVTGRLSSSQPNMQNTPPEIDQLLVSRYDN